jgi:hypothetical protein
MSNPLSIAAVTATLRRLLDLRINEDPGLSGSTVSAQPLDRARGTNNGNQLNLFLYHTAVNAAWRNRDMPRQVAPGETGQPPLALNLYYLITSSGQNNEDVAGHHLLGRAMSVLHDHALLGADEIAQALPDADLHQQVERVRITPQPLSLEELSKLWATFQTQYRISAAYQVAIVLIESGRASRTPLPVLSRGQDDRGVPAQADLVPPFPALTEVIPPARQPAVRLGETLTLRGHHLDGASLGVTFSNPHLTAPVPFQVVAGAADEVRVKLLDAVDDPAAPVRWAAGFYTVALTVHRPGEPDRTTNEVPFILAPRITTTPMPAAFARVAGDATVVLSCSPQVRPEQRAALLLGDREVLAEPHSAATGTLTFVVRAAPPGEHLVRLRIDGADTLLVDRTATPPVFDATQKVTIT